MERRNPNHNLTGERNDVLLQLRNQFHLSTLRFTNLPLQSFNLGSESGLLSGCTSRHQLGHAPRDTLGERKGVDWLMKRGTCHRPFSCFGDLAVLALLLLSLFLVLVVGRCDRRQC